MRHICMLGVLLRSQVLIDNMQLLWIDGEERICMHAGGMGAPLPNAHFSLFPANTYALSVIEQMRA